MINVPGRGYSFVGTVALNESQLVSRKWQSDNGEDSALSPTIKERRGGALAESHGGPQP